jgi:hypothetical protein
MLRRASTPGIGLQRMLAMKFQETTMNQPTGTRDQQDGDLV